MRDTATLRVAVLQMTASGTDQEANLRKGDAWCREAKARGADIALFPEMWNVGYTRYAGCPDDRWQMGVETRVERQARAEWQAQAISQRDSFFTHFQHLARGVEMAIALTYLECWPGRAPRNTVSLIDRRGEVILTYAKVHTCDFSLEAACTPGEDFCVTPLDTDQGTVSVGAMICFDREFPESARILMLNGAEIILVPNACEMEVNRLSQLRARAFENMVGIALANYAAPQQNGHSVAFDGMAFEAGGRSRDMCLFEAGEEEGVYLAHFDLDALRTYREREVFGDAFRRPHRYELLTSSAEKRTPFRRVNSGEPSHSRTCESGSVDIRAIVGGLLVRRGTVLLGKRAPARTLAPNAWDVFGGHVEPGESVEAALVRELGEELGIHAKHFTLLDVLDDPQLPDGAFPLFLVDDWEGIPHNHCPEEHTEIRWFSLEEIERIPLAHPAYPTLCRRILTQHQPRR